MNDATPPFRWFHRLDAIANRRELSLSALLVVFALAVAACADEPASDGGDAAPPGRSTSDLAAATSAQPAAGAYELVRILPDVKIEAMTGAYPVPGAADEMIVLTKMGQLWRVSLRPEVAPTLFGDISERLSAKLGREQGLLGLAFSPTFESDRHVYLFYSSGSPDHSVLARYTEVDDALNVADETVILEVPQPASKHNGGQIAFGPDGYLYVALGDGGLADAAAGNAQNLGTLLGSLLRIEPTDDGYDAPPDNPFVDLPGARSEIYAYGFRNPWRFSFDRATGEIWLGDVGEARWEEVDRVTAGGNYGWGIFEGLECFRQPPCTGEGLIAPRAVYSHEVGCSITGGYVYRGAAMPELTGWYIYGDFCTGTIWGLDTGSEDPPVLLADSGRTISSFAELPDGELIAVTFDRALFRFVRRQP